MHRRTPLSHFTLSHAPLTGDFTPAFDHMWARDPRRLVRTRPWSLQAASPSLHGLDVWGSPPVWAQQLSLRLAWPVWGIFRRTVSVWIAEPGGQG